MDIETSGYILRGLDRKNIILGKNGCGKSHLLKTVEQGLRSRDSFGALRYLSPERGGTLQYDPGTEYNIMSNEAWLGDSRRMNQATSFRQQSAAQFARLERLILREIERNPAIRSDLRITFDTTVDKLNTLLDRVFVERTDSAFQICDKKTRARVDPGLISSGESELISLGIECLVFEKDSKPGKQNILFIDEPDVHLHPDLQARFAKFVEELVADRFILVIATHSTALLGAFSEDEHTRLAFMRPGDMHLEFAVVSETHKKVLPVFGAHPLSNVFNQAPVLLLEGEDDERIWQQAVRSSRGRIAVYPAAVDSIVQLAPFETEVSRILECVYDNAVGYSLRDRDLGPAEIDDVGPIRRMRLNCRAAENLLLSDECLARVGVGWDELRERIVKWLASNAGHPHHAAMQAFADSQYDRQGADLKDIRNDLMGLAGSNKPWEVVVGQSIAGLKLSSGVPGLSSLEHFLGAKVCTELLK